MALLQTAKSLCWAPKARDEGDRASGAAYAFVRADGVWEEKNEVFPLFPIKDGFFGYWVAMSENTVVISAHPKAKGGPGLADGAAAFVYSSVDDFGTPPFGVNPLGLQVTTLGQIKQTALLQNFPNPFNPETWFPYVLANDVPVSIRIWDVRGQLINELALGVQKGGFLSDPRYGCILGRAKPVRKCSFYGSLFLHNGRWAIPSHAKNAHLEIEKNQYRIRILLL